MKRFRDPSAFFVIWIPIVMLTFISLWFAAARDEGMMGNGIIRNFVADLFWIFRFPTHSLLWDWMDTHPLFFFPGLIVNTGINSLIIYILINLFLNLRSNKPRSEN